MLIALIVILTLALVILAFEYARLRAEVAGLRIWANHLLAARTAPPAYPDSIAGQTAARIRAEREEEANVYGVEL